MLKSNSSEYEPLIDTNNPFYDQNESTTRSKPRLYSYIKGLVLTLIIAAAILIYLITSQNHVSSPIPTTSETNWVLMEPLHTGRNHIPKHWAEKEECNEEHPFVLTLVLKQQNTESLYKHVAAVSHPKNKDTFHQYWTPREVRSFFKPSSEALNAVTTWLKENGFTSDNGRIHMLTTYGNVIRVSLTCGQANKLLNTKYMFYENSKNGKTHLRVKDGIYNIPDFILEHIDFVSPTIRFPLEKHTLKVQTMNKNQIEFVKSHTKDDFKKSYTLKKDTDSATETDEDSDADITPNIPARIYSLYDMTDTVANTIGNDVELDNSVCRQSIASFIEQYYSDNDISLFWEDLDVSPVSPMERIPSDQPEGFGSEAELDTQYITSTGKGIYTYVYYIDSDDIFVSLAEAILDTEIPPLVVSISYGADEYELGADWVTRCNEEFGKLALIGTTVLASSGDSGIRGNDDDCLYGDGEYNQQETGKGGKGSRHLLKESNKRASGAKGVSNKGRSGSSSSSNTDTDGYTFVASFPATAPYVTSVGGTEGGLVQDDVSDSTGETAWLYSGGGFSIYFDSPEWQTNAVNGYLSQTSIDFPDESRYTSTGRAYPDISAQSVDYVIAYDSAFYLVSGTSASSPTVAGMISMINYARIKAGKSSLGFLNPSLYALYDENSSYYFNDVTEGYNIGCECDNDIGFYAAEGWDPLTGVGTPKFSRLYDALLNID